MSDATCLLCDMEDTDGAAAVFRDPLWAAEILPGYEVPGWVVLRVRRHAERITGLDDAELATFARRARDLVAAVSAATGTPTTYLLVFGENYPHFHALITPRGDDIPADLRAGNILRLRAERANPESAARLLPALRSAYADRADSAAQIPDPV